MCQSVRRTFHLQRGHMICLETQKHANQCVTAALKFRQLATGEDLMIRLSETQLKGSFPPIVTPFKDNGAVDYDTYAKLVDFHAKGGSHGIVVTGTTGEPSTLTP